VCTPFREGDPPSAYAATLSGSLIYRHVSSRLAIDPVKLAEGSSSYSVTFMIIVRPPPPSSSTLSLVVWWGMWQWTSHLPGSLASQITS
jgi:hypothetical protein